MLPVTETRLANLRTLIEENGGVSKLAKKMGYANPSFLSQMAGPNPSREITEKSARKLEKALGMKVGTLDVPAVASAPALPSAAPARAVSSADTTTLVADVIRMVGTACEDEHVKITMSKFADVVALVYQDTVDRGGSPQPERVRQLARLLK